MRLLSHVVVALTLIDGCGESFAAQPGTAVKSQTPPNARSRPPAPIERVMELYCDAAGHNPFWCPPRSEREAIPLAQQWEVIHGYCFDRVDRRIRMDTDEPVPKTKVCDELKKTPVPLAIVYNPQSQRWKPNAGFEAERRRHDFDTDDATGKPTLYLSKGETLGVIVEELNSLAYRVERGETTERQVPGFESIQTVLSAAGGALSAFASIAALREPKAVDAESVREEAVTRLEHLVAQGNQAEQRAFSAARRQAQQAISEAVQPLSKQLDAIDDLRDRKLIQQSREELAEIEELARRAETARRLAERIQQDQQALVSDLKVLTNAAARLKGPFNALRASVDRLEHQIRRLVAAGRQLNNRPIQIGRRFDDDIEAPATWAKLFDALRSAQLETDREIGLCQAPLEKFGPVVVTDPKKAVEVHSAALDFLKELHAPREPVGVARPCAISTVMTALTESVVGIKEEAATLARKGTVDDTAATRLRELQADARDRFLETTRSLSRHIIEFVRLKDETAKIFEKEVAVKKQAELSRMLSDRARNASLRTLGEEARSTCAAAPASIATGMSLELLKPHPQQLPMQVYLTMHKGGQTTDVVVLVPGHASVNQIVPIGVADVDFYKGCQTLNKITVGSSGSETAPLDSVAVVSHQGFVVSNRIFVHERAFEGSLSKIRTEKVVMTLAQPDDQLVISGPNKLETTYDIARRSGQLFGANVGVIYTPLASRSFALIDPTPESLVTIKDTQSGPPIVETVTPELKKVAEKNLETKAGQLAAFLNVRAAKRHWIIKPGAQIGFGLDPDSPSILFGPSLEVTKYIRFGGGVAWISATDIRDPAVLDTMVPAGFEIPTEKKFRGTWYLSFSFAIDSLPMFSRK